MKTIIQLNVIADRIGLTDPDVAWLFFYEPARVLNWLGLI